jgi:hypothetical protein
MFLCFHYFQTQPFKFQRTRLSILFISIVKSSLAVISYVKKFPLFFVSCRIVIFRGSFEDGNLELNFRSSKSLVNITRAERQSSIEGYSLSCLY